MDFVTNLFKKSKPKTVAPSIQPEQNNSPNKSINLLDATTTSFENSILMPATDLENLNTFDVTPINQENQRPRFSILGTFDPIYQKKESADHGKSDSYDVEFRSLIDETFTKQQVSEVIDDPLQRNNENLKVSVGFVKECAQKAVDGAEKNLVVPENELNKSNVSNVSSVSDVSEQNNTVILSKTFTENKEDNQFNSPVRSANHSVLSANEESPLKLVPRLKLSEDIGASDLSDSFLEKFTRVTVISTPSSKNTTRATENILDNTSAKEDLSEVPINPEKFAEELDSQDADSIELENPISQSEDFDTDSLNEEIESAQNEILHELSVESNKIVCELNKTQEIYGETVASETTQGNITFVAETDSNANKSFDIEKEKLSPIKLEQKEQIIQEINVTYSEPISPNKLERQEEVLIEQDKSQLEEKEPVSQVISPNKVSVEIVGPQSPKPVILEKPEEVVKSPIKNTEIFDKEDPTEKAINQTVALEDKGLIPQESDIKNSEPIAPNTVELPTEILNTPAKSIEKSISFEINSTPTTTKVPLEITSPVVDKSTHEVVLPVESKLENKNLSFVIASSPIVKVNPDSPQKLFEVQPEERKPNNINLSFVIGSSPIVKANPESPQKIGEVPSEISSPAVDKSTHEVVLPVEAKPEKKNLSFVIEASPIVKTNPESPQKLSEVCPEISYPLVDKSIHEVVPSEEAKPENKNLSFVIGSSPIGKANPESPQKFAEVPVEISSPAVDKSTHEVVPSEEAKPEKKNLSFVIGSSPIGKANPESPQKFAEVPVDISSPAVDKSTHEVVPSEEAKPENKNLSFVIGSSPIGKANPESPQKISEVPSKISSPAVDKSTHEVIPSVEANPENKNLSFVIGSSPTNPESPQKISAVPSEISSPAVDKSTHEIVPSVEANPENKNLSFVIGSSPIGKANPESPQKIGEVPSEISTPAVDKSTNEVVPSAEVNRNLFVITESSIAKVLPESPKKNTAEVIESEDIGVKPLEQISKVSSDIIVKTPQKVELITEQIAADIQATPTVKPVISETSGTKDKHMSEAKSIEKSEVSEPSAPTNEMGEVINQKDCFQKQADITNGAFDNKESLDPKNGMYNEMVERLSLLESDCEKYKIQVADLKREIKTCRQKSVSLESEVADLKRKENELNIILDECKNKKLECTEVDGKDEELKLLRASEESLKNEVVALKVLVKQHENKLKELQQKEVKLADDLSSKTQSELQISRVMEEYEKSISSLVAENEKMKKERDTAQMHLSNIELAFSDVHQKYERCKRVVQGYKDNEESYRQDIAVNRETIATQEQKYATLKAHAMAQLEKSNQELLGIKKQHETEMARLTAQLKRYEIKNDSLMEALQQKTKECEQLSAVCDEFIGNV